MAEIYKVDGSVISAKPKNNKYFSLKELQTIVKGYIQIVDLGGDKLMVCNEEGAINGMPVNKKASEIFANSTINRPVYIHGDVLICKSNELD